MLNFEVKTTFKLIVLESCKKLLEIVTKPIIINNFNKVKGIDQNCKNFYQIKIFDLKNLTDYYDSINLGDLAY